MIAVDAACLALRLAPPWHVTGRVFARSNHSVRVAIAIAAVLLAGCGSEVDGGEVAVDRAASATAPYDGPLDVGAVVAALECGGETPFRRGTDRYDDGLHSVQGSAEAALDD
jgi:hypothetical protein